MITCYAADEITGEDYIIANRDIDRKLEPLVQEKAALAAALRSPQHEDFRGREHPAILRDGEGPLVRMC
jgi:hypothetical protein